MWTKAGILVSHCPHAYPLYAHRPWKLEGRSPCRENNGSLPIQIPWWDTHFLQFKEETLIQLGLFFGREKEISFITKILAADWLRSHVTIILLDKSRYDLILKINETA